VVIRIEIRFELPRAPASFCNPVGYSECGLQSANANPVAGLLQYER
jgi:hypothetical protein